MTGRLPQDTPSLAFGSVFAERMTIAWYKDGAWSAPSLEPVAPLPLHPAAHVLHYGSSCFEGLKAYRFDDGGVRIFRLDRHVERMRQSARLLCLPEPPAALLEEMICVGVGACRESIPRFPSALYIRPTLIGTQANIGAAAAASAEACLFVLLSPVGDYFSGGARPLRVLVEDEHMRAPPGFGMAKTGGNYAAALRHILAARESVGADQVLFCPGGDVQETGASNFLLLDGERVITKPLDGSFLPGVTRDSLLQLAARLGYRVEERDLTVSELLHLAPTHEAALSGTAAVLAGVGVLVHRGVEHPVGDGGIGPHTRRLREALTALQSGRSEDHFGWLRRV